MSHTPGPWTSKTFGASAVVLQANNEDNRLCYCYRDERGTEECKANARLIAAAPELLESAKKLVNEISGVMGAYEFRQLIGNTNFAVLQERWQQMRDTIAKAEGQ